MPNIGPDGDRHLPLQYDCLPPIITPEERRILVESLIPMLVQLEDNEDLPVKTHPKWLAHILRAMVFMQYDLDLAAQELLTSRLINQMEQVHAKSH